MTGKKSVYTKHDAIDLQRFTSGTSAGRKLRGNWLTPAHLANRDSTGWLSWLATEPSTTVIPGRQMTIARCDRLLAFALQIIPSYLLT